MTQNSITVIKPYKWEGMWVFDDARVELVREPFVAGADTLIDVAIEELGIENADQGFLILFSATPFPSADLHLEWVRGESDGNVYVWRERDLKGWLCPALLKYFDEAPQELWVQLKQVRADGKAADDSDNA
jgi:hypothetical protein